MPDDRPDPELSMVLALAAQARAETDPAVSDEARELGRDLTGALVNNHYAHHRYPHPDSRLPGQS